MSSAVRRRSQLVFATLLGVSLAAAPLIAVPASANIAGTGVVINEAYLHGGSSGATYLNKFVELHNPTDAEVTLDGTSIQYRSSGGTANPTGVVALTGTIAPGGYYLVQGSSNAANGAALPTPDASFGTSFAAGSGTIFFANQSTALTAPATGSLTGRAEILDLIGYGSSNTFEGTAAAPASVTSSVNRTGSLDTDVNAADFSTAAPTPTNTAGDTGAPIEPEPDPDPTPVPDDLTAINAIQGTSDISPLAGTVVKTSGIVTAAYPTGGFEGFYLQTAATGGDLDFASHTASHGVFAYSSTATADVQIGDHVQVVGTVVEFFGMTEVAFGTAADVTQLSAADVVAPTPVAVALPTSRDQRETLEGMLLAPQGDFTVTNNYTTNQYAEIGLAAGTTPLVNPSVTALPGSAEYQTALADNAGRAVTLDDGATTNYLAAANQGSPVPYLSTTAPVRIGAAVSFSSPVVFDFRNDAWKFQPTTALVASNAATVQPATFADTRTSAPENVGGNIRLASFNVLNYFSTTGDSLDGCRYYSDRAGVPTTVSSGCDARGAATQLSFERQQAKIVSAINALDADVVSLEEIENSAAFGKDRDDALANLTAALNAAAGSDVWAFVASPAALPASEDVIRTAFIYKPTAVETVGESVILTESVAFNGRAREPLAQAFQLVGDDASSFLVIVNHFKSKGSGTGDDADQGDGQGASNPTRVEQATALVAFADQVKADSGIDRVFLTGDFNAYDLEDPIQVLLEAGYINQGSKSGEYTYAFGGTVGSLDHVFASPEADATVNAVDVWNINSVESVALEYSRYNNNVTDFYVADAYRSSDHDPVVLGLNLAAPTAIELNLLNINDFHGRIDANTVKFAATVEQLRAEYGDANSLFLSDGDNIGASLFASASQNDQPTIEVLNALDLAASGVGNHEFDQGFSDLESRVADAADFDYLGANVYQAGTETPAMQEYALLDVAGITVGVIGAVTEETPALVSPNGIATLSFGDPVAAVNRVAAQLSDGDPTNGEADVLIAEYHEGAGAGIPDGATLEQELAAGGAFANIVNDTAAAVDAIFTGHTHKQYAWNAQVPGAADGVTRPVLQTGNYGENVGQVVLSYDVASGDTTTVTNRNVARSTAADADLVAAYPRVAEVQAITNAALAEAAIQGNVPVGSVIADITRACLGGVAPCAEDRMAPSTMGALVANSLRASLADPTIGGAEIGIVNPGGMRADLSHAPDGVVTYAEANAVLPFLNNLWTTSLTGAQFKTVLEQQWQTNADGTIPSRPFLQLGLSDNVNYTFDASRAAGDRVTGIWIDGAPIDPAQAYRIGSFNFLLTGGDNFREFKNGTDTRDSGLVDRDAWISYIEANSPLTPSFAANQASITGAPTAAVDPGDTVTLTVGSLNLTSLGAPKNTQLALRWSGTDVGTASVDSTGTAAVTVTVPADAAENSILEMTAVESGTVVRVAVTVAVSAEPGNAPTAAPSKELTQKLRNAIDTDENSYRAGDAAVVEVGVKRAGEYVSVWAYSKKKAANLGGWLLVSAEGTVTVTLPDNLTHGKYSVSVQNVDGDVIGWTDVKVDKAKKAPKPGRG
ncbi:ExeM/NucH family extracellular endonuclease [Cryobacterium luteum]|uniref:ExeM/NucH family extracellular endonuclease n=1 Tax=Cryobacterium luteum TaxID=1424661 RepID=A0A1H8BRQ6_9MICO|nr:ExeM/NucH family extracellular endonuclease [Cryobacterium luteum]TFB89102.1 ExeM/NucH family extracellular endonuclease [Cryobacterium luteum]SEM85249.1 5'-nucleotidase [Cryobacterium luteum]